jgi:hypothetical protein
MGQLRLSTSSASPSQPRTPSPPLFLIGKDRGGHWVVQDQRGLCGGLFVNRAEALKYALFENSNHPEAVIMVPGFFELDLRQDNAPAAQAANGAALRAA